MRLNVHHRLKVVDGSVFLAMFVSVNLFLSLLVFYPVMIAQFAIKWDDGFTYIDKRWFTSVTVTFLAMEMPRLYMGWAGNKYRSVAQLIGFIALTLSANTALMIVWNIMAPQFTALDFSLTVCELTVAGLEVCYAVSVLRSMIKQNTVDFFIYLGDQLQ
jgi:hypothetical protein